MQKSDLEAEREVTLEEGKTYALDHGISFTYVAICSYSNKYRETSCKTGENVDACLFNLAREIDGR